MQTLTNSPSKVTMHGEMLTYGLKRGTKSELLHIDSVPNGLGCNCVCPHCKHELLAKNGGSKNTHHFAHASGAEECGKARMTALHILAQQILAKDMKVMLPDYIGKYYPPVRTGLMVFDEVLVEKNSNVGDSQIRPDCIGIKYDEFGLTHKLLIEIRVTHKVDEHKLQHIRSAESACIEIDLSEMLKTDYSVESITQRLKEGKSDRIWLSCPKYDAREAERQKQEDEERERIVMMAEEYLMQRKEEKKLEEYNKQREEEIRKRIEEEYRKSVENEHRKRREDGRRKEEYRLRHQEELQKRSKSIVSSLRYYEEQEFKSPNMSLDRRDRIIQAVHRKSIIPTNENYSEEFVEEFNKLCQEAQKP